MKLSFLGATFTVTGSKYLLEEAGKKYLIDCGLFQGPKELRLRNREPFPVDPRTIEAVILTHAHLDHSGFLPLLVKQGFTGKILASHATRDLCEILLLDSGRIQEQDARQANLQGYSKHKPALPLYTEADAEKSLKYFECVDFDTVYPLAQNLTFQLAHSGHILGSSFVTLKNSDTTLVFSGDIGRPHDPIMTHPVQIQSADYLVMESTYGGKLHPKIDVLARLEEVIQSTISKGGSIIIPAFAVGRSQSLLYYLYKLRQSGRLPSSVPIFLDSPMAQDATRLWCKYGGEHALSEDEVAKVCGVAEYVQSGRDSERLDRSLVPSIILSASGMAEGGRVLHHLMRFAPEEKNTILFAGYQAVGTRGDRMLRGEKEVKIEGRMIPVRARIENLEALSSHADYEESLDWLRGFTTAPKRVFLTHGEAGSAEALKSKIEAQLHWAVTIPHYLESFDLKP